MIKLIQTGKCKDCPNIEIKADVCTTFDSAIVSVRCIHEDACERIEEIMEEQDEGNKC